MRALFEHADLVRPINGGYFMVKTRKAAVAIQNRRFLARKPGVAKAVQRYVKRNPAESRLVSASLRIYQ